MDSDMNNLKCRRCNSSMRESKALANTPCAGIPDFVGQGKDTRGQTFSMTGPAQMVSVYKCISCGWSVR